MNISNLGTIRAAIKADTREVVSGIATARTSIKGFGTDVPKWVKPVSTAFLAAGTVVTGALTKMIFDAAEYGDSLDKLSLRTGYAVEDLSELAYAAGISGSNTKELETALRFLAGSMDETAAGTGMAKEKFDQLGISVVDASGKLRPSKEVLLEVATGISELKNETEQVAVAMDIFGSRGGPKLLPLLKQGEKGITELMEKARELGLTMSTESAAAAAEFTDRLTDIKESAKMAGFNLGSVFLPAASDVLEKVTESVGWFNNLSDTEKKVVGWGTAGAGAFAMVAGGAGLVITKIPSLIAGFNAMPKSIPQIAAVGGAFIAVTWAINQTWSAYKKYRDGVLTTRDEIQGWEKAIKDQVKAFELLNTSMSEAKAHGYDPVAFTVSELNVDFGKLNKLLGGHIKLNMNAGKLHEILAKNVGETDRVVSGLQESEDGAAKATEAMNKAMAALNKTLEGTEWGKLTKEFQTYTAITGEGWGQNARQAIAYYEQVKAGGLETAEAERGVTNTIELLWQDWYKDAAWLSETATKLNKSELAKRSVVDGEYMGKRTAYREKNFAEHRGIITKATSMIKGFFDWEVLASHERSEEAYSIRAAQYAREAEALDRWYAESSRGEEQMMRVLESMADEELNISNRVYQEKVKIGNQEAREREELAATFLRNAEQNLEDEMGTIEEIYSNFLPFFEKYNLDLTAMDKWRADEMLKIEKQLTVDKVEEITRYSSAFEERLMNDAKMAADYWGAIDLVTGRFDEEKYLASRKGAGGYIYQGLDPDYVRRLNYPLAESVYDTPAQRAPQPQEYEASTMPGTPSQGDIHIHIGTLVGGDEAWANDFAEDMARRIRDQGIKP